MHVNGNRSLFGAKSDDRVAVSAKEFLAASVLPPSFELLEIRLYLLCAGDQAWASDSPGP